MLEQPVRSLDELDPDGSLRKEHELFLKWKRLTAFERLDSDTPSSFCLVSRFFDSEGREIEFCSIPDFARFLDSDECHLHDRGTQKRFALYVRIKRFGRPEWKYLAMFRKSFCPDF